MFLKIFWYICWKLLLYAKAKPPKLFWPFLAYPRTFASPQFVLLSPIPSVTPFSTGSFSLCPTLGCYFFYLREKPLSPSLPFQLLPHQRFSLPLLEQTFGYISTCCLHFLFSLKLPSVKPSSSLAPQNLLSPMPSSWVSLPCTFPLCPWDCTGTWCSCLALLWGRPCCVPSFHSACCFRVSLANSASSSVLLMLECPSPQSLISFSFSLFSNTEFLYS